MLSDPIALTLGGSAVNLPRTGLDATSSTYKSNDGSLSMRTAQSESKGKRRTTISLLQSKVATDPLTAVKSRSEALVSTTVTSVDGWSLSEIAALYKAQADILLASSSAMLTRVIAGEK